MRKVQPSDRLRKEIQTFFEGMGSVDNGAEALSDRPGSDCPAHLRQVCGPRPSEAR